MSEAAVEKTHFIRNIIKEELNENKIAELLTRFPPEPNGYLHVGHAKAICLNFGLAQEFKGRCYLRLDDTNPTREEDEYVRAIMEDVRWLGFDWEERLTHASDYYEQLYQAAVHLIKNGKAYVDSSTMEQIREARGTLQQPGTESPDRNRAIADNLMLFEAMRAGKHKEGEYVLRAKIDMRSGNINMRDPVLYRIRFATHQRTGDAWCIYPMYDFAHPLSDAYENITHSICTLEFQDHRPLYDWLIENCPVNSKPRQFEFARLNLSHTITSKRKLRQLVEENHVTGWDDPRLPTLRGMRKRGFPPVALKKLCELTGVSKSDSVIDMTLLEDCVRDELNNNSRRAMCVLNPLKVVIDNYDDVKKEEMISAPHHPQRTDLDSRVLPFTKELYIEQSDFMLDAPKDFHRLTVGKEVRLRNAYVMRCDSIETDPKTGAVTLLHCSIDPETLGKNPPDRKVKGVIHWVSATFAKPTQLLLYDRLFTVENPGAEEDFTKCLNPDSLTYCNTAMAEPALAELPVGETLQFERVGYFVKAENAANGQLVYNRIVNLKTSYT